MHLEWRGDRAVVLSGTGQAPAAAARALRSQLPGYVVRPGMTEVIVEARRPELGLPDLVVSAWGRCTQDVVARTSPTSHLLEVDYCGEDLGEVASILGKTQGELVGAHCSQTWQVAMVGFAPGFGYLVPVGLSTASWGDLARRASPRSAVPAGSVAVAAGMSAVYPSRMPGGWHLIGVCDALLFDPADAGSPSLLQSGDTVHFTSTGTAGG